MYNKCYDSKMREIIIPLRGFQGFHHTNNNESENKQEYQEDFIGRESILDKLQAWLEDNDKNGKYSGAYLITGFRGMGKSSFVHKTIENLKKHANNNHKYIPVHINVGNDLLPSKELLYIICKRLAAEFEKNTRFRHSKKSWLNLLYGIIASILIALILVGLGFYFDNSIIRYGAWLFSTICLIFTFNMRRFYYFIWKITDWHFFITVWQIKKEFNYLEERIDSELSLSKENGTETSVGFSQKGGKYEAATGFSYNSLHRKKTVYPIAQTTEMQDMLVQQLKLIKNLPHTKFRFIFIIDELDKVSPEDNEKQALPEYNFTNVVNGNSTYRSRQKALASLLANRKYFISSSEAKFVFITGYDMYEASLADISNREFSLHSIFNGQINVSSFFRKTGNSKGADSMIEEYLCHILLNPEYPRKDLSDYAKYCRAIQSDEVSENLLERHITFLRHFGTYLFYMSNGSPKKLAIYLEKYIRSKDRIMTIYKDKLEQNWNEEIKKITFGIKEDEDCKWFFYFDDQNIQKIEFINYIIYPMIKNLIDKSSIYTDKLLVSTSFMISNLYKFHKSGFSLRNLEYMPELLDINKTPELRDFIGGILQFLNQTHIDESVANLYKFKFPIRLSEEITFFSKRAEETSYLFNFSHDELLSIKKLYNQQLEHYTNMLFESPAIASIRHMLGDIYMLEENYEQAIFEFNEAIKAIGRQKDESGPVTDTSQTLFLIRVTLKLGLAYEKRKTFDTAYITYENLVGHILDIAKDAKTYRKHLFHTTNLVDVLKSKSSFFANVRIMYLGLLAKIAVLEKMDLGGIRNKDLFLLYREFEQIHKSFSDEVRPVTLIDFHTKLGDILYYKNLYNKDLIEMLKNDLDLDKKHHQDKYRACQKCSLGKRIRPCLACLNYSKGVIACIEQLHKKCLLDKYHSKSIIILQILLDKDKRKEILRHGNVFLMAMSHALVGLGNTLYGCGNFVEKKSLEEFFIEINKWTVDQNYQEGQIPSNLNNLNSFTKALLYYWATAETYELLTDYKSAYNLYIQMLDAILVYYRTTYNNDTPTETTRYCKYLTQKAINCTYWHYDNINLAEIDIQKHELNKKHIDQIDLHCLSSFPEIEVAIEKYFSICLISNKEERDKVLKSVINSRQLGCNKLVASLTQNIQNLYFKVIVNEEILSRIMPDLYKSLKDYSHNFQKSFAIIDHYYHSFDVDSLIDSLKWHLLDGIKNVEDKRFCLLDYLLKDTLYCLNIISSLISPLYSTTLYNNTFIGQIYEKTFNWGHILICIREIYEYTESKYKRKVYMDDFARRYATKDFSFPKIEIYGYLVHSYELLSKSEFWKNYDKKNDSKVESIYYKVCPSSNNYLTSSYLTGNAIDYYNRALEMHTSGKSYKEMMTTLFFLEDELHNDTNFMNFASELYLINQGFVKQHIEQLSNYTLKESNLLEIKNYVK